MLLASVFHSSICLCLPTYGSKLALSFLCSTRSRRWPSDGPSDDLRSWDQWLGWSAVLRLDLIGPWLLSCLGKTEVSRYKKRAVNLERWQTCPWQLENSSHPTYFHTEAMYTKCYVQDTNGLLFGSLSPSESESSENKSIKISAKKVCESVLSLFVRNFIFYWE